MPLDILGGRTCCRVQMLGGGAALLGRVLWWWQARDYATTGAPTREAFTYQLDTNARVQPAVGNFELEPLNLFPRSLRIEELVFFLCVCVCCAVRPATFPVCVRVVPLAHLQHLGIRAPVLLLRSSCSSFSLVSRNSSVWTNLQ